jgi:hypothetical protein
MQKLAALLVVALFSAVTVSAYAADQTTSPTHQKHHAKKKSKTPTVQQSGSPMDQSGRGAPQSTGAGGVQAGAAPAHGRSDTSGAPAAGGGAVASPTPKGAGRSDNQ